MTIVKEEGCIIEPLDGKDPLPVLLKASESLTGHWWISAGTLLGLYRDKGFIPGDTDLDVCVLGDKPLELPGEFRLMRSVKGDGKTYQEAYLHTPTNIIFDVNRYHEHGDDYITKREDDEYRLTPKKLVHPLKEHLVSFDGGESGIYFPVPNDIPTYLEMWYGDWKIPSANSKTTWQKPTNT